MNQDRPPRRYNSTFRVKPSKRLITRAPLKCRRPMRQRRVSKSATIDGASERAIRDELDDLVRKILRLRDSGCINEDCKKWSQLHPGHYISRKVFALRWDLRNVWLQCDSDNSAHNENKMPYRKALIVKIGLAEVKHLEEIGRRNPELQYVDLLQIRDDLRAELKRWK